MMPKTQRHLPSACTRKLPPPTANGTFSTTNIYGSMRTFLLGQDNSEFFCPQDQGWTEKLMTQAVSVRTALSRIYALNTKQ